MIDLDAFEERAAIMEFDGGLKRFEAETLAAKAQGKLRREFLDEIRKRDSQRCRDRRDPMARKQQSGAVSAMQPAPKEETRPVFERDAQA